MSQGLSYESFAGEINMAVSTIYLWEKEHPEFSEAKKIGQAKCMLWNERAMNAMAVGQLPLGKPACMIFKMKNQNNWKDSPQVIEEGKNTFQLAYNLDESDD